MRALLPRLAKGSMAVGSVIIAGALLSRLDHVKRGVPADKKAGEPRASAQLEQSKYYRQLKSYGDGPQEARVPKDVGAIDAPGSDAQKPSQIPPRGWWQIIMRTANAVSQDSLFAQAAAVTFYGLLALFPALARLVSLYGLIADPRTLSDTISGVSGVIPGGGMDIINGQLKALTSSPHKALGLSFAIGFATSLWSATAGVKALFSALNVAYNEKEKRSFLRLTIVALAFTACSILGLTVTLLGILGLPVVSVVFGYWRGDQATVGARSVANLAFRFRRFSLCHLSIRSFA